MNYSLEIDIENVVIEVIGYKIPIENTHRKSGNLIRN